MTDQETSVRAAHFGESGALARVAPIFAALEQTGVRYCILHGWQSLAGPSLSDLDLAVAPDGLDALAAGLRTLPQARLVQRLQHESSCHYIVVALRDGPAPRFVPLDVATDYRCDGRVYLRAAEMLAGRQRWRGVWVASPQVELAYLLVKRLSKGELSDEHARRLAELNRLLGPQAARTIDRLLGARWGVRLRQWLDTPDPGAVRAQLVALRRALRRRAVRRDPWNPVRYWLPEIPRVWRRWRRPTGLTVAVLGPDGSGKTTLIRELQASLARAFRRTLVLHHRPALLRARARSGPVTEPHDSPSRSTWTSVGKLLFYLADYTLGHALRVRGALARSTLVLFDRYYDDLLADPVRYRYGGPRWAVRAVRGCVPRPDLYVILDAPPDAVRARSGEVSAARLGELRDRYRELAGHIGDAIVVDASLPASEVGRSVGETVLDHLEQRAARRTRARGADARRWIAALLAPGAGGGAASAAGRPERFGYVGLGDGRGYLVSLRSRRAAAAGLALYNAQRRGARLFRSTLRAGLRAGIAQPFLPRVRHGLAPGGAEATGESLFDHLREVVGRPDVEFAVSLGTPGPGRKPVMLVVGPEGEPLAYVKVGWDPGSTSLVRNEAATLERLEGAPRIAFEAPRLLHGGPWRDLHLCVQTGPPPGGVAAPPLALEPHYTRAVLELAGLSMTRLPLEHSEWWRSLLARTEAAPNPHYRRLLRDGIDGMRRRAGEAPPLTFCLSHGDLAPWNAKRVGERLFLFDWEGAEPGRPAGWDLCHWFVQTQELLARKAADAVCDRWRRETRARIAHVVRELEPGWPVDELFALYLLDRLSREAGPDSHRADGARRAATLYRVFAEGSLRP